MKNQSTKRANLPRTVFLLGAMLVFTYLTSSPKLQEYRNTMLFTIGIKVLASLVILFFAFLHRSAKNLNLIGRICMILGILLLLSVYLPAKAAMLSDTLIFVIQIVLLLAAWKAGSSVAGPGVMTAISFLKLMTTDGQEWAFVNNSGGFHFWPAALVGSIGIATALYIMLQKGIIKLKDDRISERIAALFLTVLFGFLAIWTCASNLNYALDTSVPQRIQTVVEDKKISSSSKNTTYYLVTSAPEGELRVDVSEGLYYVAEIGDRGELLKYQGAFGDPYYVLKLDNIE